MKIMDNGIVRDMTTEEEKEFKKTHEHEEGSPDEKTTNDISTLYKTFTKEQLSIVKNSVILSEFFEMGDR